MRHELRNRVSEIAMLALLLVLNGSLALHIAGVQYASFSWEAAALTYYYYESPTPSATATASPTPTSTQGPTINEGDGGPADCSDGIDNDNNGLTDCADPTCQNALPCLQAVPVVSRSGITTIAILLGLIGLAALARPPIRRR